MPWNRQQRGIVARSALVIVATAAKVTARDPAAVLPAAPVSASKQGPLEVMLKAALLATPSPAASHDPREIEALRTPSTADSE